MVIALFAVAALTLAQADGSGSEPLRPVTSPAPPRAPLEEAPGVGGAGEAGLTVGEEAGVGERTVGTEVGWPERTMATEVAPESEQLDLSDELAEAEQGRAQDPAQRQLEELNERTSDLVETSEGTRQELQSMREELAAAREADVAAARERERLEGLRRASLREARELLAALQPDVLHDSTGFARALELADHELGRALEVSPDAHTQAAQSALQQARDAFANRDLQRMYLHAQESVVHLDRAVEP